MIDGLSSSFVKVVRAKHHIQQLDIACGAFYATNPYIIDSYLDTQRGERTYRLVSMTEVDPDVPAIIGDVLNNLRSALDHLAHHLVVIGTNLPGPFRYVYFPISETAEEFESSLGGRIKGARQQAIDAIRGLKPYKTGNFPLWALHELNRMEKHRLLLTVGTGYSAHSMTPSQTAKAVGRPGHTEPHFGGIFAELPNIRMLKTGDELLTVPEPEVNKNMQFRFHIAFNEPGILCGEAILETLKKMADLTSDILVNFGHMIVQGVI